NVLGRASSLKRPRVRRRLAADWRIALEEVSQPTVASDRCNVHSAGRWSVPSCPIASAPNVDLRTATPADAFSAMCGCELERNLRNASTPVRVGSGRREPGHLSLERHPNPVTFRVVPESAFPGCGNDLAANAPPSRFRPHALDQPRPV